MAGTIPFAASLLDPNGVPAITLNTAGDEFTLNDTSNYATNNEPETVISNFIYFRRILIEHYKGTKINLSSMYDGDVLITPGSSGNGNFIQSITSGDGRYQFTLRTVPDWFNAIQYYTGDCVFVLISPPIPLQLNPTTPAVFKFYIALQNNIGVPPASDRTKWQEITEEELPVKYNTTLFVFNDTALRKCLNDKNFKALCVIKSALCNNDILCKNKCFMTGVELLVLLYSIQISVQNQNASDTDIAADLALKICNCPCPC